MPPTDSLTDDDVRTAARFLQSASSPSADLFRKLRAINALLQGIDLPSGPCLILLPRDGARASEVRPIDPECTVGRDRSCQLALPDEAKLSRRHFTVVRADEGLRVRDLGSSNGTFIGTSTDRVTECPLINGDIIRAGGRGFLVVDNGTATALVRDGIQSSEEGE